MIYARGFILELQQSQEPSNEIVGQIDVARFGFSFICAVLWTNDRVITLSSLARPQHSLGQFQLNRSLAAQVSNDDEQILISSEP